MADNNISSVGSDVWHTWLPRGIHTPDTLPREVLFRNHTGQCITDSLSTALMFARGTGHFLQYIAMFRPTPDKFIHETIERMFEVPQVLAAMENSFRESDRELFDTLMANRDATKAWFQKFMVLLIQRIRSTLLDAGRAHTNAEYIPTRRQRAPSVNYIRGRNLNECLGLLSYIEISDVRVALPIIVNGFIHTIGIQTTGSVDLQPLMTYYTSYINPYESPAYVLISSFMYEIQKKGNTTRRNYRMNRRFTARNNNRSNNNRSNNNHSNNNRSNNSTLEMGHAISAFQSSEGESWLYKASSNRSINFAPIRLQDYLDMNFPHIIIPSYKDDGMFVFRIHYEYIDDVKKANNTNNTNNNRPLKYHITAITAYDPASRTERPLTEAEERLIETSPKAMIVSFYPDIDVFAEESDLTGALFGRTGRRGIFVRRHESNQVFVSVDTDAAEEWAPIFQQFVRSTWALYREGSAFPPALDHWRDIVA